MRQLYRGRVYELIAMMPTENSTPIFQYFNNEIQSLMNNRQVLRAFEVGEMAVIRMKSNDQLIVLR